MVLAAGLGNRLKPFTLQTPKPLIPLLGVPCIDYSLMQLRDYGIQEVVVNIHAHAEQMMKFFTDSKNNFGLKLSISDESSNLLGSAGGFKKAISSIETVSGKSEPFISLNADVVSSVNLLKLSDHHEYLRKEYGVVMTLCLLRGKSLSLQNGSYSEILVDEATGLVKGIANKKNNVPFYSGTAVFETEAFHHLIEGKPAEFVPEVLRYWIEKNKVGFFWIDDLWLDIGSPDLWWKSHFSLLSELNHDQLPKNWKIAIKERMKDFYLSQADEVVDYDLLNNADGPTTKKYIKFKGERWDV